MIKCFDYFRRNVSFLLMSGFWLIALFNPVFKKYDYGGGWPLLLLFSVILAVLAFVEFKKKRERSHFDILFLLIFCVFVILSFVYSQTRNTGLSEVVALLSMSSVYFLFAHQKIGWIEKFLKVVAFGALFSVVLGHFFYLTKTEARMVGPFFNILYHANVWPNAFALFLVLSWPAVLVFGWNKKVAAALGFIISGLLLTYSRGALIAFGGQVVFFALYWFGSKAYKRGFLRTFGLVSLACVVAVIFFLGSNYLRSLNEWNPMINIEERLAFANGEMVTSKQERVDFWKGAIELAKERPLFGWGPFSFREAYNPHQKTFLGNSDHPHNLFLKIAAENGIIALSAFLFFLIVIFFNAAREFRKLNKEKKTLVYVLSVAVLGAIAHNLIDYNFNFTVNLLMLFLFLAFINSLTVSRDGSIRRSFAGLLIAVVLAGFALYEGGVLTLAYTSNEDVLEKSYYPRFHYLDDADYALHSGEFVNSLELIDKQIELNPLSAQAYYLRGVIFCNNNYVGYNLAICKDNFDKALSLNPLNDLGYYRDYVRTMKKGRLTGRDQEILDRTIELVTDYFGYVEYNLHFTAYTNNVEAAVETIDLLLPYLPPDRQVRFLYQKKRMWENATNLRTAKMF